MRVTDGAMLPRRLLAVLLSADSNPHFHRDDDRKFGSRRQGLGCCEHSQFLACGIWDVGLTSISGWRDVVAWAGADRNIGPGNGDGDRVKAWCTL